MEEFYEKSIDDDNKIILVARENNIILGYLYGFIQDNGNLYNKKTSKLDALFVKEQYRGNGIARSLIKESEKMNNLEKFFQNTKDSLPHKNVQIFCEDNM